MQKVVNLSTAIEDKSETDKGHLMHQQICPKKKFDKTFCSTLR